MIRRLRFAVASSAAALFLLSAAPSTVDAQAAGSRFRVLIPALFPQGGTDDDFGKDVSEELRKLTDQMARYVSVEKDEVKDMLKKFKIEEKNLDCIQARQLGMQLNAQIALCANYTETGDKQYRLENIEFWSLDAQQKFDVPAFAATERNDGKKAAARQIVAAFEEYTQQLQYRTYCFDYAASQNWADAMRNCEQALEMNPEDVGVRYQVAQILRQQAEQAQGAEKQQKFEQSLEHLEKVLAVEPMHEDGLQLAGWVATQLGRNDEGREYYSTYLELNPGAAAVRRSIAFKMYEAGDPEGAMLFIKEGLEVDGNPDLAVDLGNYAFAAAEQLRREEAMLAQDSNDSAGLSPEVAALYREAAQALMQAFEAKGDSMDTGALRNVISAYIQLDEVDNAVSTAKQVVGVHRDDAGLWAVYADALQRAGNTAEAIAALDEVERINPEYPDLYVRRGNWLLTAGRREEALPVLKKAVERGQNPDQVATMIFADAHANGIRKNDYGYAERMIEVAKQFDVSREMRSQLNFWQGYSIYQGAVKAQEPNTPASARATLPRFRRVLELMGQAQGYQEANRQQVVNATNTYIEIQEAIIKRSGG